MCIRDSDITSLVSLLFVLLSFIWLTFLDTGPLVDVRSFIKLDCSIGPLMQSNQRGSSRQVLPRKDRVSMSDLHNAGPASAYGHVSPVGPESSRPSYAVEFQSTEICPRNFVIFDHTEDRSQIMFHPTIAHNVSYPPVHLYGTVSDNEEAKFGNNVEGGIPSPFSEDSDDINALLSLDYDDEDQGECEEEDVSTARTRHYDGSSSPDSCSNYAPKATRLECPSSHYNSSYSGCSSGEGKRKKMQKMVKVLKGMVPGGDQMNTVAILDEAVKYLKSMKVEVQKLGVGNLK